MIQLRQIRSPHSVITGAVLEFRRVAEANNVTSLGLARQRLAREYSEMLDRVEVVVAEQPLPGLQIVGSGEQTLPFLYDIGWGPRESFSRRRCTAIVLPGSQCGCARARGTGSYA